MEDKARKILLIDDELDFTYFLKANLEMSGKYQVVVANSGKDGLELFSKAQPDLVLLDIIMPGIDGIKALLKLRQAATSAKKTPILMLSAKRDSRSILESQKYGAVDYLMKPVQIDELMRSIDRYLQAG